MDEPITADKTTTAALRSHFGSPPAEVLGELGSMLVYYGIDAQELFYKWEAYCIKMGPEELKLELETVLNFKRDVKEQVEWEKRKAKMTPAKTPKRKFNASHMTPLKNTRVVAGASSPAGPSGGVTLSPLPIRTGAPPNKAPVSQPFSSRPNPGETLEILNAHLPAGIPAPEPWEARIRLSSNSEPKKFQFRPMHQKLTEASETLDDCIDEFAAAVQAAYNLPDEAFGDPAAKTPDTIVAVGRIVNDALEGRLNAKSVLLEASRQVGAGIRTLLKLDDVRSFAFFPGQIVALRGVNASGEYFAVSEVLELPPLPPAALTVSELNAEAERLAGVGMRVFVAAGPYTPDDNLAFEALDAICDGAAREKPDVLILAGPFLDSEHHMIKMGDYADLVDHENATIEDLFRAQISRRIARVQSSLVIMVPSTRDAVSRHAVYPQEALKRRGLDLPAVRSSTIPPLPTPAAPAAPAAPAPAIVTICKLNVPRRT